MRLYKLNDLDLLYLYKLPRFSLQKAIKEALCAFVHGKEYHISYSDDNTEIIIPKSAQFHICLDEKEDKDVIAWLKSTSSGYRNSLIKNITRKYLIQPCIAPYLTDKTEITIEKKVENKIKPQNINKPKIPEYNNENKTEKIGEALIREVLDTNLPEEKKNVELHEADPVLSETSSDTEEFDLASEFANMMNAFM